MSVLAESPVFDVIPQTSMQNKQEDSVENAVFSVIPQTRRLSIQNKQETCTCCNLSDKSKAYKNMVGICFSFVLCFGSFLGILNLQSSINAVQGLGLASNVALYATFMIAGIFASPYVDLIGSKLSLISGYFIFLVYTACNYYPSWYALISGSVLLGIFYGPVWVAIYAHATVTATTYSAALKEEPKNAIALFVAFVAAATKLSRITGSIVSSIVLFNIREFNTTLSMEISGSGEFSENDVCNNDEASQLEKIFLYYILVSLYMLFGIIGIIITVALVDHLGTNYLSTSSKVLPICKDSLLLPLVRVFKTFANSKMLLLLPLFILNGLLLGFASGAFPKVFISDCIGVHWVGFVLAVFGLCGGIAALAAGRLVRYIPQYVMMYAALFISCGISLVFIFWKRTPNYFAIFGFAVCWGASEGIINAILPGLLGVLFHDNKEPAFAVFQMSLAIGFVVSFSTALILDSAEQLWIIFCVVVIATITYTILTFKTGSKQELLPCCFKKEEEEKVEMTGFQSSELNTKNGGNEVIGQMIKDEGQNYHFINE